VAKRPLIAIDGVAKTYRTTDGPVESLKPLTFAIGEGEFMAIVGPSGCGKSTLLKMVAGLLPASAGTIMLNGVPVNGPPDDVGIVFQSPVLLAWRTVLANVMLQIEMRHLPRDQYLPKAHALLRMAGLQEFERKLPWQLSGGMQQRASICRALVHEPKMLLLDEPFGALDAFTREELWCILRDLWAARRFTVILVTHDLREAVFLADTVYVMSARPGRIVARRAIDLPRPRDLEVTYSDAFSQIVHDLRERIGMIRRAQAPA